MNEIRMLRYTEHHMSQPVPEVSIPAGETMEPAKSAIYHSLHAINEATEQITFHIERLKAAGLLTRHFAEIHKLAAEQICAELNLSAGLSITEREQDEAARLEKERLKREKDLSSR